MAPRSVTLKTQTAKGHSLWTCSYLKHVAQACPPAPLAQGPSLGQAQPHPPPKQLQLLSQPVARRPLHVQPGFKPNAPRGEQRSSIPPPLRPTVLARRNVKPAVWRSSLWRPSEKGPAFFQDSSPPNTTQRATPPTAVQV